MPQKCHFIGIGGIGMSGLARILLKKNVIVTGSDLASSYVTEGLIKEGAQVFIGHSANHISPDTTVIYNTDIKKENAEYQTAKHLQCPILHRSDLLQQLMQGYKTLAVTGTHGKTTTTSLLTVVLIMAGWDPSYAVGGIVTQLHSNAAHGHGEFFVAEADESDGTFLKYSPFGAIITNIDFDHMNYFGTEANLIKAFKDFSDKVENARHLFWCGDDVRLRDISLPGISYGLRQDCILRAENIVQDGWKLVFDIVYQGRRYSDVRLSLIGKHNVVNALAVFGMALSLGVKEDIIRKAFSTFEGVGRRCSRKADGKVLILDDYAHHPSEIRTTLMGIRTAIGKRRLIVAHQCHRYTRTRDCLNTYGGIFDVADELFMTDLYTAEEVPIPGISHESVMAEIQKHSPQLPIHYVPRKDLVGSIIKFLRPSDVLVTMGAGDITKVSTEVAARLHQEPDLA